LPAGEAWDAALRLCSVNDFSRGYDKPGDVATLVCYAYGQELNESDCEDGDPERIAEEDRLQCDSLRDIFGNPFRPVTLAPAWLTSNVTALAQSIYTDRAFDRLPILADALEDAGCDNADILEHCRQPGEHVRGCWVVDLILGKS
jgi:hypothetical protein